MNDKEKIYHSRTNISEDVLLLMARVSILTKQLNGLTLADQAKKQEITNELFGSVGINPLWVTTFIVTSARISMWVTISMQTTTVRCSTLQKSALETIA